MRYSVFVLAYHLWKIKVEVNKCTQRKRRYYTDTSVAWKESCVEWKESKDLKSVLSTGTLFVSQEQGITSVCFIVLLLLLSFCLRKWRVQIDCQILGASSIKKMSLLFLNSCKFSEFPNHNDHEVNRLEFSCRDCQLWIRKRKWGWSEGVPIHALTSAQFPKVTVMLLSSGGLLHNFPLPATPGELGNVYSSYAMLWKSLLKSEIAGNKGFLDAHTFFYPHQSKLYLRF